MATVGIIGQGSFGAFAAGVLGTHVDVLKHDSQPTATNNGEDFVDIRTVAGADIVILAVPISSIGHVLDEINPHIRPSTLVVDVCSVKMIPTKIYEKHLPNHEEVLLTHPLFGPESAKTGTAGHAIVVTSSVTARGGKALKFCRDTLGLKVVFMTAEEHDAAMAEVHALTFFLARGLNRMGLTRPSFVTPSFTLLEELIRYDELHSEELFRTMEQGNPFAQDARNRLLRALTTINTDLEQS